MTLLLRYVAHSEIGLIRKNNQDSGFASPHLLVVADGMGGAAAGDLASAVAIDTVRHVNPATEGERMLEVLGRAVNEANDRIAGLVNSNPALDGMGTTLTGALFDGSELGLAHIGDSRAYRLRDDALERLTHDHSWVQSLVDDGKISEAEAANHPHRSLLLKVLNGQPANDPDLRLVPVAAGDRLLFCSDGLCGLVDDDEIGAALRLPTLEAALERLVSEALDEGGIDNITVIVADVVANDGTDAPVILGAADERSIPDGNGTGRLAAADDDLDDEDEPPAPRTATVDDEARYTPRAPGRRRLARPLAALLALVLVAAAGLGAAYAWTRTQFYVGVADERVAIYQGLADTISVVPLSRVYEIQQLAVSALPPYYAQRVRNTIEAPDLESARATVAHLTEVAERCAAKPTPSPQPTPIPRLEPTPVPSGATATTSLSMPASPSPTPAPTQPEC